MNTSATGGFLQPEPGLARSDIERLIGDVIAGITGLPRDLVRERIAVPLGRSETGATWCSFGITKRSESVIAGAALRNRGRAGHEPRAHP